MIAHQATCVRMGQRGVLIEGAPGSGKSSLALALVDRGAVLVGDDSLLLEVRAGRLHAHPHPATRGLLEVRNVGLLSLPVAEAVPVALLLRLSPQAPRFVETPPRETVLGIALPTIALWPDSPVLALRAEQALALHGIPL